MLNESKADHLYFILILRIWPYCPKDTLGPAYYHFVRYSRYTVVTPMLVYNRKYVGQLFPVHVQVRLSAPGGIMFMFWPKG